ncbi:MAG: hypothetical protein AB7T06_19695 [Kofleriaceae bacterium]
MSARAKLERQWKAFKHDEPGHRFEHQHERMKKRGRAFLVATTTLGALLLAGGLVMLFIPGPGILVAVFGLALIAGVSGRLAHGLDRAEPVVRRWARRAKRWWSRATVPAKAAVIAVAAIAAAAAALAAYRLWFG